MATAKRKRGYGNGSVYFRESDQRWVGSFTLGKKPNGRPDVKTVYGKTEDICQIACNRIMKAIKVKEAPAVAVPMIYQIID